MVHKKLTKEEILSIPSMVAQGMNLKAIAGVLGVSSRSINYQIKRLREAGIEVPTKKGPRPVELV